MPIDIVANVRTTSDILANKSILGLFASNPLCVGVVITVIIIIIASESFTFKTTFYMFICVSSLIAVHDIILRSRLRERYENDTNARIVKEIHSMSATPAEVAPREINDIRESYVHNLDSGVS